MLSTKQSANKALNRKWPIERFFTRVESSSRPRRSQLFGISKYDRNKMKRIRSIGLGYPFPRSISIDLGLLLIRLATGIFLCTVFEKFLPRDGRWGPQDWFIADIAKMGFPFPSFFAWCAVLSEFFGGILLALGLLARPAAFFNAVTTFVAAFVFHKGDVSGSALLGTVFFASTLGLTLTGPGRMSIDYLMFRLWTTAPTTGDPSDARKSPVVREFES